MTFRTVAVRTEAPVQTTSCARRSKNSSNPTKIITLFCVLRVAMAPFCRVVCDTLQDALRCATFAAVVAFKRARSVHRGESVVFAWTGDEGVYHTGGLCVSRFLFRTILRVQTHCPYETQTGWVDVACACRHRSMHRPHDRYFSRPPLTRGRAHYLDR